MGLNSQDVPVDIAFKINSIKWVDDVSLLKFEKQFEI